MMRFIKCFLCILVLSLLVTSCSTQNLVDAGSSSSDGAPQADFMPIYFDSEEQLLRIISDVKGEKGKTDATDDVIIINSDSASEQQYRVTLDTFDLAHITEFYKPANTLEGMSFKEISVKNEYVSFWYANEDQDKFATFTWFREMSPDVAMNELYGRGAISEREIEYNGVKYVFLEWADPETGESAGYGVHWVVEGKAYQASIPSGYTDDQMLEFCQFEAVLVKQYSVSTIIKTASLIKRQFFHIEGCFAMKLVRSPLYACSISLGWICLVHIYSFARTAK